MTTPTPWRVMFDSNAYDEILRHGDVDRLRALIEAGKLIVVTTHVQDDELRQIADAERRMALLGVYHRIGGNRLAPGDVIAGDTTYLSRDALLAGVAKACCDALVTHDRALAECSTGAALTYEMFRQQAGLS
jgi:rRNA-processing protein FCF1